MLVKIGDSPWVRSAFDNVWNLRVKAKQEITVTNLKENRLDFERT